VARAHAYWKGILGNCDGASAVEFAIVLPIFLMVLFGIILFGSYFAVVHGLQQITAEAARASIAGLTDDERATLAKDNINRNIASYPMISAGRLTLESAGTDPATSTYALTLRYDASDMIIFNLPQFVPAPNPTIRRSAAVQRGGY
jgi:Flp pilus assembly protein TadG